MYFYARDAIHKSHQKQNMVCNWNLGLSSRAKGHFILEPNISFEFVPILRPHPSAATYAHPCPPMLFKLRLKKYNIINNIVPMPTQNPWAWVGIGMGMDTQCRALLHTRAKSCDHESVRAQKKVSGDRPKAPTKSSSVVTDLQV